VVNVETVPDAVHPDGFHAIGGSRLPRLRFGGQAKQGIDSNWYAHASIPKTVIDLFTLPSFGVARVDNSPSFADWADPAPRRPETPAFGSAVGQPTPPHAATGTGGEPRRLSPGVARDATAVPIGSGLTRSYPHLAKGVARWD